MLISAVCLGGQTELEHLRLSLRGETGSASQEISPGGIVSENTPSARGSVLGLSVRPEIGTHGHEPLQTA